MVGVATILTVFVLWNCSQNKSIMNILKFKQPNSVGMLVRFGVNAFLCARARANSEGLGPIENVFRLQAILLKIEKMSPAARLEKS